MNAPDNFRTDNGLLRRGFVACQQWEAVNRWPQTDPVLDEDYVLRFGEYMLTVSTRSEWTAWSLYKGGYAFAKRLDGRGYTPRWLDGDWVVADKLGNYTLTPQALYRVSEPMMREAEEALRRLLRIAADPRP
jgi:hypothetical protein